MEDKKLEVRIIVDPEQEGIIVVARCGDKETFDLTFGTAEAATSFAYGYMSAFNDFVLNEEA